MNWCFIYIYIYIYIHTSLRTKLVEVIEFQLSYFKSWKMTLWKCCTHYASKFGKLSSGHRTGKSQFSLQSQRKAMPKNAHTFLIALISHATKVKLKILQARLQQYVNWELPDVQAWFRKFRVTRDQIANIRWKSKRVPEKHLLCFTDYTKAFDYVDHNKPENSSSDENTRPPYLPPEKPVCRSRSNS